MNRFLYISLLLLLLPTGVWAATTSAGKDTSSASYVGGNSVLVASSTIGNVTALGGTVAVTTAITGDLTALGGTVTDDASVAGDALLVGGSVRIAAPINNDLRVLGGAITLNAPAAGDVTAVGGSYTDNAGGAKSVFVVAAEVTLSQGSAGSVTIYANNVALSGTFAGDVHIVSSGHVALAPATVIEGSLEYQAPEEANIPASAIIRGGVHYTGVSYLPTSQEAHAIALASVGIFLFVKILVLLIVAGLLAGLFPLLAERLVARTFEAKPRRLLLTLLLGFAIVIATPVLVLLLFVTFVGLGLALLLGTAYLLLVMLSFFYGGIILGAYLARFIFKRTDLRWSDAVFGMLVLFLLSSLPYIGWLIMTFLTLYTLGALSLLLYRFAFPHEAEATES